MEKDWHYIQAEQPTYAYGYIVGDRVEDISAVIERLFNGQWRWRLMVGFHGGIEPSAETAKQQAIRELNAVMELSIEHPPD